MAAKKDPTVTSARVGDEYPEGTHPLHPLAEQDWAAVNKEYRDASEDEKPDPSSVVSVEVTRAGIEAPASSADKDASK